MERDKQKRKINNNNDKKKSQLTKRVKKDDDNNNYNKQILISNSDMIFNIAYLYYNFISSFDALNYNDSNIMNIDYDNFTIAMDKFRNDDDNDNKFIFNKNEFNEFANTLLNKFDDIIIKEKREKEK